MDYGVHIKREHSNLSSRSKAYTKQSKFKGSDREIRRAIIRILTEKQFTQSQLLKTLIQFEKERIDIQLKKLLKEKMLEKNRGRYELPS